MTTEQGMEPWYAANKKLPHKKDVKMAYTMDYTSVTELPNGEGCLIENVLDFGLSGSVPAWIIKLSASTGLKNCQYLGEYFATGLVMGKPPQ